ncbi:linoleate diol synthase [Plectosphaerella plurivora]|uniref:Linoleate diol synthase n=1 Tax=Plectosphaerella plurivora TaxID=936078 RepID=A0A9P8V383_9PEZI|nr:linoleate diol synthase [Plectosphaerella plurivora]
MNGVHSNGSSAGNSHQEKPNGHTPSYPREERPLKDHPNGEWSGKRHGIDIDDPNQGTQGGIISQYLKLRQVSKRPLPTVHGDGSYPKDQTRPTAMENIKALQKRDLKTLAIVIKGKIKGEKIKDDKTMIMEYLIQLVAKLPHNSLLRENLTNNLIKELWDSLDHPPLIHIGDKHRYREADGSNNNPMFPRLGAAGSTYARSVPPKVDGLGALPDPGLVFDSIFAREEYTKHPNNVSSILWYWATIIIHDLFWTDYRDPSISKTSSYLDLSPLYGSNQEMQDTIRTFKDGKLKPDAFADKRLLGMPPGVCVLLVMFNRFHNHVATNLAAINEGGKFTPPASNLGEEEAAAAWKKYDNDLFQVARLVTSGLYINITLVDYVRNIVNLNRTNTTWTLDPRQDAGAHLGTKEGAEAGTGNMVSAEFNLCYRWHSCISEKDDKWIQQFYGELLGSVAGDGKGEMSPADMAKVFAKYERSIPEDPVNRTFGGFKKGPDGRFNDDELAECIASAVEDVAGSFGGRNVPKVMRPVEIMGILHGRKWNLAGLNEFRKHFGLKAYETFEDINSDPKVHEPLRHLYGKPDNVELYTGLVAEEAKSPMVPGVGIAPTYTISRVVLSDAVCLVRGDRFYTHDYHPRNLTNWGFNEAHYDLKINHGCIFYKLFIRAFPNHFKQNSVYAHYPMVTPSENHKILTDLGRADKFDFTRPTFTAKRVDITTFGGAVHVLENQDKYRVTWNEGLGFLMGKGGCKFMLSGDTDFHAGQRNIMHDQLYKDNWKNAIKAFYAQIAEQLLTEKSFRLGGATGSCHVDLVRDVGNLAHVHFASRIFNLPLKTTQNPKGLFTEHELYKMLAAIFTCIFFDIDTAKSYPLRQAAKEAAVKLGKVIESNVKLTTKFGMRGLFTGKADKADPLGGYATDMVKGLAKAGLTPYDIAWSQILPTAGAMVPNQAQVFAQAVDYYLGDGASHIPQIHSLALASPSEEVDKLLLGYAMEGIRMAGTFGSYREAAVDDVIHEDDGREVHVRAGERVFVSFVGPAKDPTRFPSPDEIDPRRPLDGYIHYGVGPHACLGRDASQVALVELFRALFRRNNVRRAPGAQGQLKKIPRPGGFVIYMNEEWSSFSIFPASMKVMWDE